jgi:hypothetical protein
VTPNFFKTNVAVQSAVFKRRNAPVMPFSGMQGDSKLLSGFPFIRGVFKKYRTLFFPA